CFRVCLENRHQKTDLHGGVWAGLLSRTRVRLWWNWQTRYFEVVVGKPVQVQVLLSAPSILSMKFLLVPLLGFCLLTGCARHYRITLTNNHDLTTNSKPKLNKTGDAFVFKDRNGKLTALPAGSVKQIEPQSHTPPEDA